jgi:hypothetical protein
MSSPTPQPSGIADLDRRPDEESSRWTLTTAALTTLLSHLDPDLDRAAERYAELRRRIEKLFLWWGSSLSSQELADRTLDRLARKLEDGAAIADQALGSYMRSMAWLIFQESLREGQRELKALQTSAVSQQPASEEDEETLRALDASLAELGDQDRHLVLAYYGSQNNSTIEARKRLAVELDLSPTALRTRALRIRRRLEESLRRA